MSKVSIAKAFLAAVSTLTTTERLQCLDALTVQQANATRLPIETAIVTVLQEAKGAIPLPVLRNQVVIRLIQEKKAEIVDLMEIEQNILEIVQGKKFIHNRGRNGGIKLASNS